MPQKQRKLESPFKKVANHSRNLVIKRQQGHGAAVVNSVWSSARIEAAAAALPENVKANSVVLVRGKTVSTKALVGVLFVDVKGPRGRQHKPSSRESTKILKRLGYDVISPRPRGYGDVSVSKSSNRTSASAPEGEMPPLTSSALLRSLKDEPVNSWVAVKDGTIAYRASSRNKLHEIASTSDYDYELKITDDPDGTATLS